MFITTILGNIGKRDVRWLPVSRVLHSRVPSQPRRDRLMLGLRHAKDGRKPRWSTVGSLQRGGKGVRSLVPSSNVILGRELFGASEKTSYTPDATVLPGGDGHPGLASNGRFSVDRPAASAAAWVTSTRHISQVTATHTAPGQGFTDGVAGRAGLRGHAE